ncbi:hypothetical protein F4782DRAFT_529760 [Xylaria castorea]|nr:hypothetical protein F4782DRAFT_529760 [Xylaria castorea]
MATGKVNKWDGNAHEALAASLARIHGSITPEQQVALVEDMKKSGFDTTWEGIRPTYFTSFSNFTHFGLFDTFSSFSLQSSCQRYPSSSNAITMAPPPSPAKPVKKWDDTMVAHLFLSIFNTVDISFTPENKIAIETMMNDEFNHGVTWNGIR